MFLLELLSFSSMLFLDVISDFFISKLPSIPKIRKPKQNYSLNQNVFRNTEEIQILWYILISLINIQIVWLLNSFYVICPVLEGLPIVNCQSLIVMDFRTAPHNVLQNLYLNLSILKFSGLMFGSLKREKFSANTKRYLGEALHFNEHRTCNLVCVWSESP